MHGFHYVWLHALIEVTMKEISHYPVSLDEMFEQLHIEAFSSPPELPDVMKPQDSGSTANEQAVQWSQGERTGSRWKDGIGCVWITCIWEVLGGGYVNIVQLMDWDIIGDQAYSYIHAVFPSSPPTCLTSHFFKLLFSHHLLVMILKFALCTTWLQLFERKVGFKHNFVWCVKKRVILINNANIPV